MWITCMTTNSDDCHVNIFVTEKSYISLLELTVRSLLPLATLKSKVLIIQLAQDTAGSQKCCLQQLVPCILNSFQLLQSVGQVSRRTSEKYELIQDKLGAFSRSCSEVSVWCQTSTRVPIESNFYNNCPTDMKLNQSGQDMSLPIVIQFGGNPGCNKKVPFNFTFLGLSSLIVNVPFCHEDGCWEFCKLDILVVVS